MFSGMVATEKRQKKNHHRRRCRLVCAVKKCVNKVSGMSGMSEKRTLLCDEIIVFFYHSLFFHFLTDFVHFVEKFGQSQESSTKLHLH